MCKKRSMMVGCSLAGGRLFLGDRYLGRCNDLFTNQAISIAEFPCVINSPLLLLSLHIIVGFTPYA